MLAHLLPLPKPRGRAPAHSAPQHRIIPRNQPNCHMRLASQSNHRLPARLSRPHRFCSRTDCFRLDPLLLSERPEEPADCALRPARGVFAFSSKSA